MVSKQDIRGLLFDVWQTTSGLLERPEPLDDIEPNTMLELIGKLATAQLQMLNLLTGPRASMEDIREDLDQR